MYKIKNINHNNIISRLVKSSLYILIFISNFSQAQCAMCRASLESEGNVAKAEAVNDGILYLMVIPYVLVAIIGFIIYKMFFKNNAVNKGASN